MRHVSSRDYVDLIKGLTLYKVLRWKQESRDGAYIDDREVSTLDDASVVSSLVTDSRDSWMGEMHKVVLDIDHDSELIPSSTPGHFHLYIDREIPRDKYFALLAAMVDAGLIEDGYVEAAKRRGFTCVRLPWIKKEVTVGVNNPPGPDDPLEGNPSGL